MATVGAMSVALDNRFLASDSEIAPQVAEAVMADGYAVIENVLDADRCASLVAEIDRIERDEPIGHGKNEFEGFQTKRIFNLIRLGPDFRELVIEPTVLSSIEAILGVDPLLSGTTSMHIGPGETPQLLHADDGMITLPRPHHPTLITTLWALSDFTADNGGTQLCPGTHLHPETPSPGEHHESVAAEMPAGSVLVLHGSTWHGGGANVTADEHRYGLSIQYVAGWCRQQQNLMLGTDPETVATYPRRLQELIGYGMYKNVMGHVNREHPLTLLGQDVEPDMVWERMKR